MTVLLFVMRQFCTLQDYQLARCCLTRLAERVVNKAPLLAASDVPSVESKVKVVFLMTFNGRAVRQVRRLLKALYHTDHYFFIHVDAVSMTVSLTTPSIPAAPSF